MRAPVVTARSLRKPTGGPPEGNVIAAPDDDVVTVGPVGGVADPYC